MRVWVNGLVVEQHEALVPVADHGFTVGDGVFETTKVIEGRPFALTRHLRRLVASARGLGLPEPEPGLVRLAVDSVLAENGADSAAAPPMRLRITYTGGMAPFSSERAHGAPTLVVALSPMAGWAESAAVVTVPWVRNERSAVAGLKTTSYAENVRALAYAKERGGSEALMANTVGDLCEGTGSNVFLVLDGRLVTPPLSSGCLAGVTRGLVLEWVGAEEEDLPLSALGEAEEVFLTSATRDVMPVRRVDGRELPDVPGPVTVKAREVFAARSSADVDP